MNENFEVKGGLIYFGRNIFARLIKAGTEDAVSHSEQKEAIELLNDSDNILQSYDADDRFEYEPLD